MENYNYNPIKKLYKSGKLWVVGIAGLAVFAAGAVPTIGVHTQGANTGTSVAHADSVNVSQVQYATLNQNMVTSNGVIYSAGTRVARLGNTGNFHVYLAGAAILHFSNGPEVSQNYVTVTSSGTFDFSPDAGPTDSMGNRVVINTFIGGDNGDILKPAATLDLSKINAAISNATNVLTNSDAYTHDSVVNAYAALSAAKTIAADSTENQADIDSSTANLNQAIANLVKKPVQVDKSALNTAISNAQNALVNASMYTDDSVNAVKTSITNAQAVVNSTTATQADVNTATQNLNSAVSSLTKKPVQADKTSLNSAISNATNVLKNSSKYTDATVQAVQTALDSAKGVAGNTTATQADVDSATKALNDAVNALVEKPVQADKTSLNSAISNATNVLKDSSKYTDTTVQAVQTALDSAKGVSGNATASQTDVDSATKALNDAVNALAEKPVTIDKSSLKTELTDSRSYLSNSDKYTDETVATLTDAYVSANSVLNDDSATQSDVDKATQALKDAVSGLILKPVVVINKDNLKTAIDDATTALKDTTGYTDASVATAKAALQLAQNVYNDENATQSKIDETASDLKTAISNLQEKPVVVIDHSSLEKAITNASTLLSNSDKYTTNSVAIVNAQLLTANAVNNDNNATQADIDKATQDLNTAISQLVTKPAIVVNKDTLKVALDNANELIKNSDKYTADSVKALQSSIDVATSTFNDANATQADVDDVTARLSKSVNALVLLVNKDNLNASIVKATGFINDSSKYTADSVKALNDAMISAQKVYADNSVTQSQVDMATQQVDIAISGLIVAPVKPDKSALNNEITKVAQLLANDGKYTDATFKVASQALENASAVANNDNATQADVDSALKVLIDADNGLVINPIVKSDLSNEINKVNKIDVTKYTDATVKALETALATANEVVSDENATQADVDSALSALKTAEAGLTEKPVVVVVDRSKLSAEIATATKVDTSKYTDATVKTFESALATANEVVSDENATQADVDSALSALKTAEAGLTEKPVVVVVDRSKLSAEIATATKVDTSKYTDATVKTFESALATANEVVSDENATQADVDSALSALKTAEAGLTEKPVVVVVDRSKLSAEISIASQIDMSKFTDATAGSLQYALDLANKTFNNKNATQADVDYATDVVKQAIVNLIEKPVVKPVDMTQMDYAIHQAENQLSNANKYTDATVSSLKEALKNAINVRNSTHATQADVDAYASTLRIATRSLTVKQANEDKDHQAEKHNHGQAEKQENHQKQAEQHNAKQVQHNTPHINYIVKDGDTLTSIAEGNKTTIAQIVKDNNIMNPNDIATGQKIVINKNNNVDKTPSSEKEDIKKFADKANKSKDTKKSSHGDATSSKSNHVNGSKKADNNGSTSAILTGAALVVFAGGAYALKKRKQ